MESPVLPAEGSPAPDFSLTDDSGIVHRLGDQCGRRTWTVLYFYPEDDTPGCSVEACEFRDADADVRAAGAQVWGVSPQGRGSKQAFRRKFALPFILLVDEEHRVAERYGAWVEKQRDGRSVWGVARTTFLIDPEGRVARVWHKVRPEGHAAEVLEALASVQRA
jgi:peroxiredoxin Q/BCP